MVDVRKCFIVLALFALIAGGAFAQVNCTVSNAAQNTLIRDGGLTEQVGILQMSCLNTGNPVNVSFSSIMNTTVSNPLASGVAQGAKLTVGTTTVTGVLQTLPAPQFRNQIIFNTVTIPTTTPDGTTVTITGIRVVSPFLPASSFAIQSVTETVTTTGATDATTGIPTTVTVTNPMQIVATVQPGLSGALTDCAGSTNNFSVSTFAQCVAEPSTAGGSWNSNIRFSEGFTAAFKSAADEAGGSTFTGNVTVTGTLLMANFSKLPAGVRLFVTNRPVITSTTATVPPGATPAAHVNTDFTDVLRTSLPSSVTAPICAASGQTTASGDWREIAVGSDGTASVSWEVDAENPAFLDTMQFGILVVFSSNTAAQLPGVTTTSGPVQITAELGPISSQNFAVSTGTSQNIPRFTQNIVFTGNLFTISPCVTNLLFPYVTLGGGFDTGIAISNTSLDQSGTSGAPFTTTTQAGTCTAFYFTKPTATQVAPQTTGVIAPGEVLAFALSQGGVPGATSTVPANFTGYMIVRCNFQFAHGFAFVSDLGAQKLAQGYLALVIPDATPRKPAPFSRFSGNVGEILGN